MLSIPPIIHVAGAVTDTDETYGAYVAAENNTFNNIKSSNSSSNSNGKFQKYAKILRLRLRKARSAKMVDLGKAVSTFIVPNGIVA